MWKHVIIDDFLSKEHFERIIDVFDTKPIKDGKEKVVTHTYMVRENTIEKHSRFPGNINTDKFDEKFILDLYNTYTPKLLDILKELAPEKLKYYHKSALIFTVTPKDYIYPNHTDVHDKLLSVVIYLKPESNTGTMMYETEKKDNPITVEWKQNRALIFSRTDKTWHSYQGDGMNDRYVLVYNLMAENLKLAKKIK